MGVYYGVALWVCLVGVVAVYLEPVPDTNIEQTDLTHIHNNLDFIILHTFL